MTSALRKSNGDKNHITQGLPLFEWACD